MHTQKPWAPELDPIDGIYIKSGSKYIANIKKPRKDPISDEDKSNAYMISASPDMFDVLRNFLSNKDPSPDELDALRSDAMLAIQKAKGLE